MKYFSTISFCGEMVSISQNHSKYLFLIDHHCKTQSELIDIIENSSEMNALPIACSKVYVTQTDLRRSNEPPLRSTDHLTGRLHSKRSSPSPELQRTRNQFRKLIIITRNECKFDYPIIYMNTIGNVIYTPTLHGLIVIGQCSRSFLVKSVQNNKILF